MDLLSREIHLGRNFKDARPQFQQLTVLRDEELLEAQRMGKSIDDQLKSPKALTVIGTFYKHYCKP